MKSIAQTVGLGLLMAVFVWSGISTVESKAQQSAVLKHFQIRQQWAKGNGYCGEVSIQMAGLMRGAWVSQQSLRDLIEQHWPNTPNLSNLRGEALLGINMEKALRYLGFNIEEWHSKAPSNQTTAQEYMLWVKQQLIRGNIPIFAAYIKGGKWMWDTSYDHFMPYYGVRYTDAKAYDAADSFVWTDNLGGRFERKLSNQNFYAGYKHCQAPPDSGCIPNDGPNFGTSVVSLMGPTYLYQPTRLKILGWSDGTKPSAEPLVSSKADARYQLDISDAKLANGEAFSVFRCNGETSLPKNARNLADLRASGCQQFKLKMSPTLPATLNQSRFGKLQSHSVVFFLVVKGH